MADQATTDVENTETVATESTDAPKPTETVEFWKQKAREQERRAKANADAAAKLTEIENASKSDADKTAERIAAAEKAADDARREATRYKIATEFKLAEEDAAALEHVVSEDGMRLVAERLAARSAEQSARGNHVPREGETTTAKPDQRRAFANFLTGNPT